MSSYYSEPSRVNNSRCWGEMKVMLGTTKERERLRQAQKTETFEESADVIEIISIIL